MGSARCLGSSDSPALSLRTGRPSTRRFGSCPRSDRDGTRRWYGRWGTRCAATGRRPSHGAVAPPRVAWRPASRRYRVYVRALYVPAVRRGGRAQQTGWDQVHVVVMGCGRVGSAIARRLEAIGHSVAVIDQDAEAFRRLGPEFGGRQVTGLGFDRQTLLDAGIDSAGAFAAVSSGDNSNIISARVARETFGVEHVVARIYDSKRAEVYERMGIPSVA